jgi:hypothetical protein
LHTHHPTTAPHMNPFYEKRKGGEKEKKRGKRKENSTY